MDIVLYQFLVEVPLAVAIWSVLLVVALGVLTFLVARPQRDRPAVDPAPPAADPVVEEAADLRRYAEEVAVAAAGAAQTARRRRDAWLVAQGALDRAWQAYDEAEAAARRFSGGWALPAPRTPRTPAEYAARERWLHHAATVAHLRGELSIRQLCDVFAHRGGWDPRLHPVQQEVVLARAVRDGKQAGHRAAVARERAAWRDAELAAEAARALAAEAYAAAERANPVRVPAPRPATAAARRTVPAARWRPARVG
ncbi:hypothetical protein C5N14_19135 [Micromonospora sp. MW-13]|uniref:hypothetical protein n=1 Tax=unclassified Micromonospora TaxID=2617518 RepID=UPI000E43C9DC|nr:MULTISPECIES: hypothetical protein [unclassified Micromonospora]MCX4473431.1 hypothetical protein [Micromonospora sp. NBC_01655]RGC67471.1 hypothetical protein C5N14_19135 [Micromonospora sp. MW-13]